MILSGTQHKLPSWDLGHMSHSVCVCVCVYVCVSVSVSMSVSGVVLGHNCMSRRCSDIQDTPEQSSTFARRA